MKRISLTLLVLAAISALPAFAAPTCVQGASGVAPTASLTFTAPTKNTDGTAISTYVQRLHGGGFWRRDQGCLGPRRLANCRERRPYVPGTVTITIQ